MVHPFASVITIENCPAGKLLIDVRYDDIQPVSTDSYRFPLICREGNQYGMVNKDNSNALGFVYEDLVYINSFLVGFKKKEKKYGICQIYDPEKEVLKGRFDFISYDELLKRLVTYDKKVNTLRVTDLNLNLIE